MILNRFDSLKAYIEGDSIIINGLNFNLVIE